MSTERRRWFPGEPELRVEKKGGDSEISVIHGYASVFNSPTVLSRSATREIREVIRPGAFKHALATGQDVVTLLNHDPNIILGRSTNGTLHMREDERGLYTESIPPKTTAGRDTVVLLADEYLRHMSFAFLPRKDGETVRVRNEGGLEVIEVEILSVDLFDVSVVTNPAYRDTWAAVRSADVIKQVRVDGVRRLESRIDEAVHKHDVMRRYKADRLEQMQRRIDDAVRRAKKV
jgi:HK97 family phage prohead protease